MGLARADLSAQWPDLEHLLHLQGWVPMLLEPAHQLSYGCRVALICDLVQECRIALPFADRLQLLSHGFFQSRRHPHHALEAALRKDELGAEQVAFPNSNHSRYLLAR